MIKPPVNRCAVGALCILMAVGCASEREPSEKTDGSASPSEPGPAATDAGGGSDARAPARDGATSQPPASDEEDESDDGPSSRDAGLAGGDAKVDAGRADGGPADGATSRGDASAPVIEPRDGAAAIPSTTTCEGIDPVEVLRRYAPKDEDLAKDYDGYVREELGTLTCATSGSGDKRALRDTIFVPPGATYDGKGETLTADAQSMRCDTSEGEQAENQRPLFVLAPGASLRNVIITYPGCEGVHMMGDNTLHNVVWQDAGEDAASVRSYFPGGKITIANSEGHKASDKMFQFNAPCDVRIENFKGSEMGKLVRQNGGETFPLKVDLNNVSVTGVVSAVVQSDSPACTVRHHGLVYMFTGGGDKSDRVFRDVLPENVMEY